MVSVIIPTYKEPYLNKTINSLLEGAEDIEIIPVIDNYPLDEPILNDPRVKPIILTKNLGMRGAINEGLKVATGEFLMKIDSHCVICNGWDKMMPEENWLMIPRRYGLDEEKWDRNGKIKDYHYLTFPGTDDPKYGYSFQVQPLKKTNDLMIDDTMTFQGSCWIANRKYFMEHVGFLDDTNYGTFAQEQQEIGLKYWLGGGAVKVNKNIWYAHLFKKNKHYDTAKFSNRHKKDSKHIKGNEYSTKHWMNDEEKGMIHTFKWLIDKFQPLPGWENYEGTFNIR
jgi:glycosyltransferase involved in cell wall biosynthesis